MEEEEEEEEGRGGGRRREMGTDASLPERACSMLRSLTILPEESSDLIATQRLKSHYLYFAKAAPCSELGFCVGATTYLNTGELDLLRRGVAKRELTSARLPESDRYPDLAAEPTSSPRVRVQHNSSAPHRCLASLSCIRRPVPQFRILTLCSNSISLLPSTRTRILVAWYSGFTTPQSQCPLQLLRPTQLLLGASPPTARAEPGSSLSSREFVIHPTIRVLETKKTPLWINPSRSCRSI